MEFQVLERMMLLRLLADAEGDITTLRIVRDTLSAIGFSEEDLEALAIGPPCSACQALVVDHVESDHEYEPDPGRVAWRQGTAANVKEIDLGKAALKLIAEKLLALSVAQKLTMNQLVLYERFVEEEKEDGSGE